MILFPHTWYSGEVSNVQHFPEALDAKEIHRLAEAQRTYDNAKPGDCIQIDPELWPYINRTEK